VELRSAHYWYGGAIRFAPTKIAPDPALAGRDLAPLDPQPAPIAREYVEETGGEGSP
jgi:hypothetical protein